MMETRNGLLIDPDDVKAKAKEYVDEQFSQTLSNSTLIVSEKRVSQDDMKDLLLLNSIKCTGSIERFKFVYRVTPQCYLAEDAYGMPYGAKVTGVVVLWPANGDPVVAVYFDDQFLSVLVSMLVQFALVYDESIFEAYVRAFLMDEDAVIIAGPEDYEALLGAALKLSGGKESVRMMHIETDGLVAVKVPRKDLAPLPYDALGVVRVDDKVFMKPVSREEIFNALMQGFNTTRSRLFEILANNDELRNAVEEVIKRAME